MKTVYWSPFFTRDTYPTTQLLYDTPVKLLDDLKADRNKENHRDNFYSCHAFLKSVENTFVLKLPIPLSFGIDETIGIIPIKGEPSDFRFVSRKEPSQTNRHTFAVRGNWIFWSEESLEILTTPAYYHHQVFDGFYVSGSFNINKWFRPIEGAIQLNKGVNTVNFERNDPIAYIKFLTDEPVVLKRFYLTEELEKLSWGCIWHKNYEPTRSLNYLYNIFGKSNLSKIITKQIKENIME